METKIEQSSATNPNPVLSVEKDGTVLYSNAAGEPLLHEWGVGVGEKLPFRIRDFMQRVISWNSPEKMEVKVGNRVYLVAFHPSIKEDCVNVYGFDISDQKELEGKYRGSEAQETANMELADIVDARAIQSLMDDFYKFAHVTMALVDLKGNVLVGVGWQDICTKFHRVHPDACKHCVESDTKLSGGVSPGEFKLYKCKNNMWDIATPIIVGGQHVGNIFSGQFFFEDEPLDYEFFRSQARQYSFNEEEYIAALEKVPRLSRETVDAGMAFLTKLANMLSQLGYSNIKLAKLLAERNTLVDSLQEIEKRERSRSDELAAVLDAVPVAVFIARDPQALHITGNRLSYEWIRIPVGTNFSKSAPEGERPEIFKLFKDGVEIPPADMPSQMSATGIEINDHELDIVSSDGNVRHVLGNARPLRDEQGNLSGSVSAFIDITERKKAEEALRLSNIYNRSLIEASLDPQVTIGPDGKITDVNGATEQVTGYSRNDLIGTDFSDYFTEPEKARTGYQQVFTEGEVRDYPLEIRHKDGHITHVLYNASVYKDENGEVIGAFAAARDITERKRAERALRESEEKYRIVADNTFDWEFWLDPDGRFLYTSPSCERVTGYAAWEFIDKPDLLQEIIHPDDRQAFLQHQHDMPSSRHGDIEFRIVTKDGEIRWIHHLCQPLYDGEGRYAGSRGSNRDTTERKRAKETLAFERSQLLSIFDGIDDVVYVTDPYTYEVLYANKAMKEKFGGELVGGICYREFQRKDSPCDFCTNPIILKERDKPYHWEYYNPMVDRYFMIMDRIIKWPDGRNVRFEIAKDITERKKAEVTLRKSEERFKALVNNLESGVFLIDGDGKFAIYNLAFLQIFNISEQELEHMKIQDLRWDTWNVVNKDGTALRFESHPVQFARLNHKPVKNQVIGIRRYPHDEWTWTLASAEPLFNPDGSIDIIICTFTDITELKEVEKALKKAHENLEEKVKERTAELQEAYNSLKESEERLADAQKIAHVGSWDWNIETNEEYWSDELYHIFGLDPHFELNHNTFLNSIHPEDLDYVNNTIKEALNRKPYYIDYRIILPDGEERVIYSQGGAIFDEKNKPIRMRGIVQDITERKRAEEALAKIEISRKQEIHHRIKNNLQVISSLLDLQAEKFINRKNIKDSEVLEAFRESQDRVISMALIHEELHRSEGLDKLNFSQYIEKLADTLFSTYKLGNTEVRLNLDLEEDFLLDMDTSIPLGIIINELVSNSLKHAFSGRDKGEIRIELHREEKGEYKKEGCKDTSFTLIISDNGVGIPENLDIEDLESLGLQLVASLVDQLDGELELKRNNGTEFTIRFTVVEEKQASTPALQ